MTSNLLQPKDQHLALKKMVAAVASVETQKEKVIFNRVLIFMNKYGNETTRDVNYSYLRSVLQNAIYNQYIAISDEGYYYLETRGKNLLIC